MLKEPITNSQIDKLKQELEAKYKRYFSTGNDCLNILVAGVSGVGKSTLINSVFGDNVAETGVGKPVTKEIKYYSGKQRNIGKTNEKSQISFYDTIGLEMVEEQREKVFSDIENLMELDNDETPHLCWYCVNAEGARIQDEELEFIGKLCNFNIPVIVVLTQSYTAQKADSLEKQIRSEKIDICDVVQVVSQEKTQEDIRRGNFTLNAFGLDDLVCLSLKYFKEFAKMGKYQTLVDEKVGQLTNVLINEQKVDKKSKKLRARKVVGITVTSAAAIGASPIPFSDAPLLVIAQEAMMLQIGKIYQKDSKEIAVLSIGTLVTSNLGKTLVGNVMKFIPGFNLAAYWINGSVAAAVTGSLGMAGIGVCESSLFDDIPLVDLADTFISLFKMSKTNFNSKDDIDEYVNSFEGKGK